MALTLLGVLLYGAIGSRDLSRKICDITGDSSRHETVGTEISESSSRDRSPMHLHAIILRTVDRRGKDRLQSCVVHAQRMVTDEIGCIRSSSSVVCKKGRALTGPGRVRDLVPK